MGAWTATVLAPAVPAIVARRLVLGEEAALRAASGAGADRPIAATARW